MCWCNIWIFKVGDLIIVNLTTDSAPRFNRVSAYFKRSKISFTCSIEYQFAGVSVGTVLSSATPTGIHVARPQIFLNDSGLYAELPKKNISDVALAQSKLFIKAQVEKSASSNTLTVSTSDLQMLVCQCVFCTI